MGGPKGPMCVCVGGSGSRLYANLPAPAARRPAPAARTPGTPPLKAKKCASAAGNAWAFDFARIHL